MKFKEVLQESTATTYLHARYSSVPASGDQYAITLPASSEHEALANAHVSHRILNGSKPRHFYTDYEYDKSDQRDRDYMKSVKAMTKVRVTPLAAKHIEANLDDNDFHLTDQDDDPHLHIDHKKKLISHKSEL